MPPMSPEKPALCAGCGGKISDRYYLLAVDKQWHLRCLKCCECKLALESELTCFAKDGSIYCKEDYYRYSLSRRGGTSSDFPRPVLGAAQGSEGAGTRGRAAPEAPAGRDGSGKGRGSPRLHACAANARGREQSGTGRARRPHACLRAGPTARGTLSARQVMGPSPERFAGRGAALPGARPPR